MGFNFSKRTTCAIAIWCIAVLGNILGGIAEVTNRTIDDSYGDSVTGDLPVYLPPNAWQQGNQCSPCFAHVDRSRTFGQTWRDATLHNEYEEINVTMKFTGTAVYAYCILSNNVSFDSFTHLVFSINGGQVGSFLHNPDGSGTYLYDQLVYGNSSLQNKDHVFVIHVPSGPTPTLTLFDYVRYTYNSDSPIPSATPPKSSASPTASSKASKRDVYVIDIGIAFGVVIGLILTVAT